MSSLADQPSKELTGHRKSKVSLGSTSMQKAEKTSCSSRLKMRRKSFGFSSVFGVKPVDRSSTTALESKRPQPMYLPTYQLTSRSPFKVTEVTNIVNNVLDEKFTGHIYSILVPRPTLLDMDLIDFFKRLCQESPQLALLVATETMRRVKEKHYNRYRIISVATVGQKRSQSYNNAISFMWDYERDAYVDVHRDSTTVFIQVTVFGVYLD